MIAFFADDYEPHDPKFQYFNGTRMPHPEASDRVAGILAACRRLGVSTAEVCVSASAKSLATVHSRTYVDYVRSVCAGIAAGKEILASEFIRDTYTPLMRSTYAAARKSAALALRAGNELLAGGRAAYALCRPPGHHAEREAMMGFCYFNNAALVAEKLSKHGRVAILDIDYHHGNGTQRIFYERRDVLYVSLHADPAVEFPHNSGFSNERGAHDGEGFTYNFPMPKDVTPQQYIRTLEVAIRKIGAYAPRYVVLSLGFDTYKHDPIAGFGLDENDYQVVGKMLADGLPYPTAIIQEGGYNVEKLGLLAERFFAGYLGIDNL